jgi:hypothetical protein
MIFPRPSGRQLTIRVVEISGGCPHRLQSPWRKGHLDDDRPRLYLYRKTSREVWDAEMWLSNGRRRVWRTGIVDKVAAMAAAQVRLEALAAVQIAAAVPLPEPADPRANAATDAPAGVCERLLEQTKSTAADLSPASEEQAQALQPPEKAREKGALTRFDRWFFSDLASLWRGEPQR